MRSFYNYSFEGGTALNSAIIEALALCALLGFVIAVITVNLRHWHRRRRMTRYERAIEDAQLRNPGDW